MIVGKIGSGKTTLLQLFLKEVPRYSGEFMNNNTMAYVGQDPFIISGTFRENILFGKEMDQ